MGWPSRNQNALAPSFHEKGTYNLLSSDTISSHDVRIGRGESFQAHSRFYRIDQQEQCLRLARVAMRTILSINFPDLPKQLIQHLLAGDFRLVPLERITEDSLFSPSQAAAVLIRFRDGLATAENVCIEIKKLAPDMPLIVISPNTAGLSRLLLGHRQGT
jgi:hypothetical protein